MIYDLRMTIGEKMGVMVAGLGYYRGRMVKAGCKPALRPPKSGHFRVNQTESNQIKVWEGRGRIWGTDGADALQVRAIIGHYSFSINHLTLSTEHFAGQGVGGGKFE